MSLWAELQCQAAGAMTCGGQGRAFGRRWEGWFTFRRNKEWQRGACETLCQRSERVDAKTGHVWSLEGEGGLGVVGQDAPALARRDYPGPRHTPTPTANRQPPTANPPHYL
jgi:hypothetical protein